MNGDEDYSHSEQQDRKASSMNSMFICSTITNPNVTAIIKAVALIIHSKMIDEKGSWRDTSDDDELYHFSEEKYLKEKYELFDQNQVELLRAEPSIDNIREFMKALYCCIRFSPECCIISLVYINRLTAFTNALLQPDNWRPLILCSLLVAQKVWDDRHVDNSDFSYIYPFFTLSELNRLEQKFLQLIQYSVHVKSSLYANYYFKLRLLLEDEDGEFPLKPLSDKAIKLLELRSEERLLYTRSYTSHKNQKTALNQSLT
eukprot:CAMPEP_0168333070 /NCGR_PEP_ID=MMETSP0213-20121227/9365_1 /TAXON_ID=151035 /ORGANISM="Euplotes harpa, Strain FSP1.4" /LENGTH=258 /DNA_ID=CAMNT_0008337277 /DNA_START=11 /DNA_END=787 /DNA_ORIENTATION=+